MGVIENKIKTCILHMEASEPKCVNSILNIIDVNSLRLGGLHIQFIFSTEIVKT